MAFLSVRIGGGADGTEMITRYLPVLIGVPAWFVLVVWYGRRCMNGGRAEAGIFHGGLRCWIKVGLLVRTELGNNVNAWLG